MRLVVSVSFLRGLRGFCVIMIMGVRVADFVLMLLFGLPRVGLLFR